jgi:hypothetical protein
MLASMRGPGFIASVTALVAAAMLAGCAAAPTKGAFDDRSFEGRSGLAVGTPAAAHLGFAGRVGLGEAPAAGVPVSTAALPPDDARICRAVAGPTGSRLGVRSICMTLTEWQAKTQNDRDQLEDASSRALSTTIYGED